VLPGKRYRPDEIAGILVRRIWWLIIPWAVVAVATGIVVRLLPDRFQSESIILVVPPRVPESLVKSTVTDKIATRLPSIQQQILSRTRLERIIQDFGLYEKERKAKLMEDIVRDMRTDITVSMVKGDAFYVRYISNDARTAMKVTERLASLFVEDNLRDREVLAEGTNQFLESQLDDARRRLLEHEKKLEEYRKKYGNELPSQMGSNLQAAQNVQTQLQAVNDSISRDRDRRLLLERMIADSEAEASARSETDSKSDPAPPDLRAVDSGDSTGRAPSNRAQLAAANSILQALLLRLKPEHPDVVRQKRTIAELEAKVAKEPPPVLGARSVMSTAGGGAPVRQNRLSEMRAEIEGIDREIARKEEGQARLQTASVEYQRRAEAGPTRDSELVALNRDYETLQKVYNTLLAKSEEARLAANLEHRQIGEQFKIIDPARLPEQPVSPDRVKLTTSGVAVGLMLGLVLVAALEVRETSFGTDNDVISVLSLPVLAMIPLIITDREKRAARRTQVVLALATVVILVAGGGLAWKLRLQDWLR
jgi:polysaccharide chain length determinant protein (PEP-CTERM system associated)